MGQAGVAAFALALVFAGGAGAADYEWRIVRVVDGDTVRVDAAPDLPPELARLSVRVRGVDTPEKGGRAKCAAERRGGLAATTFTGRAIRAGRRVVIRNPERGKWGGRVIADVLIDGRNLAKALLKAGLARPMTAGAGPDDANPGPGRRLSRLRRCRVPEGRIRAVDAKAARSGILGAGRGSRLATWTLAGRPRGARAPILQRYRDRTRRRWQA